MNIFEPNYKMAVNPPKTINEDEYYCCAKQEYLNLLDEPLDECDYQRFFERNPAFMPGAREIFGASTSHWPILNALISQPRLSNDEHERVPDFMWIAKDSLALCPVLIEIEKPSKLEYRNNSDVVRAHFTQAHGQIIQWKAILDTMEGRLNFYDRFKIPEKFRKLEFNPQYLLIYGRRSEYEANSWLTRIRAKYQESNVAIMSYDRLIEPDRNATDCVTCKLYNGEYHVINIPPTFTFRPATINAIDGYSEYNGFIKAVDNMEYTSEERKEFLKERFNYWKDNWTCIGNGLINTSDKE